MTKAKEEAIENLLYGVLDTLDDLDELENDYGLVLADIKTNLLFARDDIKHLQVGNKNRIDYVLSFRPIKTQAEIERERAIMKMYVCITSHTFTRITHLKGMPIYDALCKLHDAGY